jgi:hypothetical protein
MNSTKKIFASILVAMIAVQVSYSDIAPEESETWRNSGIRGSTPARLVSQVLLVQQRMNCVRNTCTYFDTNFISSFCF